MSGETIGRHSSHLVGANLDDNLLLALLVDRRFDLCLEVLSPLGGLLPASLSFPVRIVFVSGSLLLLLSFALTGIDFDLRNRLLVLVLVSKGECSGEIRLMNEEDDQNFSRKSPSPSL